MRAVLPGFVDPVMDAQQVFRAMLSAFAEPAHPVGVVVELPELGASTTAVAVVLALLDIDTPLWAGPSIDEAMRAYLRFHTGVRFVNDPHEAAFALVPSVAELPRLELFNAGTAMSPETSTTVIVGVDDFVGGTVATLDGPGFASPRRLAPAGFDTDHWRELMINHQQFPAGIDLLLCSNCQVVGLPRSTRITINGASGAR